MSARRTAIAVATVAAMLGTVTIAPAARAQGEIVRLTITVAPVVAAGAAVPVTVEVDADQGALSLRSDHLRLRVRYATECAGTFAGTPGSVAIDARIPDPGAANSAYHATLGGSAVVTSLGSYTVCAYLEEEGSGRLFAQDSDTRFTVTSACTAASRADLRAAAALRAARRRLAHAHGRRRAALRRKVGRLIAQRQAAANSLQTACAG